MRVNNINNNLSFGKVTRRAAEHALKMAEKNNNVAETKSLIAKGTVATHYDIDFDAETNDYFVYRNKEVPKGISILSSTTKPRTESFSEAISCALKQQRMHNTFFAEFVKTADTENILNVLTVDAPQEV